MNSPWRLSVLLALAFAMGAGLNLWLMEPSLPDKPLEEREADWRLPKMHPDRSVEASYQRLARSQPWGKEQTAAAAEKSWFLRGIVATGEQRHALIDEGEPFSKRYRAGEVLVNGDRLLSIGDNAIEVERQEQRRRIKLYQTAR